VQLLLLPLPHLLGVSRFLLLPNEF
jgi:hypothetical protein